MTRSFEFSPGGELLVSGDESGNVKFSSDGRCAATGYLDGSLRMWDSVKREQIASTSIEGAILAIRFEVGGVRTAVAGDLAIGPVVNSFAFQI